MCSEYCINGKIISYQKDLVEIFPINKIVFHDNQSFKEDNCLCGIDAWETAKKNGIRVVQTAMYYHFGEDECNKAIAWEKSQGNLGWWSDSALQ